MGGAAAPTVVTNCSAGVMKNGGMKCRNARNPVSLS
jgi:hypothetical protein